MSARDAADWYPSVESYFDGFPPSMTDIAVHRGDKTVMTLLFETDRPPYVVRNPVFGNGKTLISYEVPWREGTRVRTARREDLFRILVPQAMAPQFEIRRAASKGGGARGAATSNTAFCWIWLYVVPATPDRAYLPLHRCGARIRTPNHAWPSVEQLSFSEDTGERRGDHRRSHVPAG